MNQNNSKPDVNKSEPSNVTVVVPFRDEEPFGIVEYFNRFQEDAEEFDLQTHDYKDHGNEPINLQFKV